MNTDSMVENHIFNLCVGYNNRDVLTNNKYTIWKFIYYKIFSFQT